MPGICGYWNSTGLAAPTALLRQMTEQLQTESTRMVWRHQDPAGQFGMAAVSLGILSNSIQPATLRDGELLAMLDGELYDMDLLRERLRARGLEIAADDFAGALLATFATGGAAAVADLDGSFAAAVFDTSTASVTLMCDVFGTRPLYYAETAAGFLFASRIASVLADRAVSRDLDWRGVSQFFTFGHYFNDDTSLAAVKIVPAGGTVVFDARKKRTAVERYWTAGERTGKAPADRRSAYEEVDAALFEAIRKRSLGGTRLGLALSGGLDARTILGVFAQPAERLQTVCLGMAGSRDHRAAAKLAAIAGCPHESHILDGRFLAEFRRHLNSMVGLTDGQYLSQCIVMPTFPVYQQLGVDVLLRGHGGELMHMSKAYNYSLNDESFAISTEARLADWLWQRLQAYLLDGVDGPLFADSNADLTGLARESLQTAIAATPSDQPAVQRIAHLFIDQRLRRETTLSLMKFRSVVEPRMPYMDRALVETLMAMPVEWKLDDQLQTHILRKRQPRFCKVENTNTGSVLGAGRFRRNFAGLRMKVFSKMGMPGYQPYERLGLWLRRELAPLVEEILLDDACLERGIFTADTVRTVVRAHLSGQRNHTYLIMAMLVFETGQRTLRETGVEIDSPAAPELVPN